MSLKPGIILVWLGVIIGVTGGLIAAVRRTLEGRAKRAVAVPAPRRENTGVPTPGVSTSFTNEPPTR